MTDYGKFHDFCRDSGNLYSTLPSTYPTSTFCRESHHEQALTADSLQRTSRPLPRLNTLREPFDTDKTQLFDQSRTRTASGWDNGCNLTGIPLSRDRHLANLGAYPGYSFNWHHIDHGRFHRSMRTRDSHDILLAMEIGTEEGSRWKKVGLVLCITLATND